MARVRSSPILQLIGRIALDQRVRQLSDHDLLQKFYGHGDGDEAAFHALLLRHGPMVLEVCRGVLGSEADAEDAFQATFLILARKASSIRKTASVGSWLHGVAYRTALKARARSAARRKFESRAPVRPVSEPDDLTWREVRQVLHEELAGLAERYRAPLVACYLEGKTQDEAAAQLGFAKTTLKERLEHGRSLLRARLVRRGLGPAAVLLATTWPSAGTSVGMPTAVLSSTIRAARLVAAGRAADPGTIPVAVAALSEGVLKSMSLTKLQTAVAVLLAVVMAGAGLALAGRPDTTPPAAKTPVGADGKDAKKAGAAATADDKKDDKPALSGTWGKKDGALKIEFADKGVMKIAPHGDSAALAVVCDYSVEKAGLVKAKVTGAEGNGEAKKHVEERLPAGTKFTFQWTVKANTARLEELTGDKVELLKHLLVGDFEPAKDHKKRGHAGGQHNHHEQEAAPQGKVKVDDKVPDVSVRTLDGKGVSLSELRKDAKRTKTGVVVLMFWCTTCHSCRDVEELLAKLSKEYEGEAAVFALTANANEAAQDVIAFLKKKGLELPVVLDPGGGTADLFGVRRTTTTVVIDGNGVLRYCGQFRQKDGGSAEAALKAVLAGKEIAVKTTPHLG